MNEATKHLKIIFTADVHGNYFPYDFRHEHWGKGSLQRVHAFVANAVQKNPGNTLLIDGGDMLQGEPTAYYFNNHCENTRHRVADICNYIGYDVAVIGNHDIEMGRHIFDKYVEECNFPVLGANVRNQATGEPYFQPYEIFYRQGLKIAVIGFITPAIPHWIPKEIWQGIHFDDICKSAEHWVKVVREEEKPDFVIGLMHSGMDEGIITPEYKENATRETAENVEGFDLILYGHDHASNMEEITTRTGKNVPCINPGCYAYNVAVVDVDFRLDKQGQVTSHETHCALNYIGTLHNQHAASFKRHFSYPFHEVKQFATQKIGTLLNRVDVTDAYFGSSAYIDLIQSLQLKVSGADISFSAPLFFNASIEAGDIKVSNLFDLYRFEDHLYTLHLSGAEIKNYLEMSYAAWTQQMHTPTDPMLLIGPMKSNPNRMGFKNFIFNFDSAAGIRYEVDVTKPEGEKVRIFTMEDGRPFCMDNTYTVAMTAYRANGGGELLTKGAGLSKDEIDRRIIHVSEHDIRRYLMEYVKELGIINPQPKHHWRFVPEAWAIQAAERERKILFGSASSVSATSQQPSTT
ncbi:MAG: bifunctional metallophosphatase/5'-nucleotidase [Bacteroidaceae bacterium]|nr:bifunctional metallophosphatase/5'-nucleotidase [Bacteroidaceae bacterium]